MRRTMGLFLAALPMAMPVNASQGSPPAAPPIVVRDLTPPPWRMVVTSWMCPNGETKISVRHLRSGDFELESVSVESAALSSDAVTRANTLLHALGRLADVSGVCSGDGDLIFAAAYKDGVPTSAKLRLTKQGLTYP